MLLNHLFEDAAADIEMRTFIAKVTDRVMATVANLDQVPPVLRVYGENVAVFYPEGLGVGSALPTTMFGFAEKTDSKEGQVINFTEPFGRYDRIVLIKTPTFDISDVIGSMQAVAASTKVRATLMHELTHCMDDDRTGGRTERGYATPVAALNADGSAPTDRQERAAQRRYYNCGPELNAYYHDIVGDLAEINVDLEKVASYHDARDILDSYGWTGDFKNDLVQVMDKASVNRRAFLNYVKSSNQRKMLRRLYQLHAEIMRRVNALP